MNVFFSIVSVELDLLVVTLTLKLGQRLSSVLMVGEVLVVLQSVLVKGSEIFPNSVSSNDFDNSLTIIPVLSDFHCLFFPFPLNADSYRDEPEFPCKTAASCIDLNTCPSRIEAVMLHLENQRS